MYDGDRKPRFIDIQTTGDKLNETERQTRILRNGHWTTRTFKHLLKIIKISHIPLYIYTHSVEVPSDLLKTLQSIENNL